MSRRPTAYWSRELLSSLPSVEKACWDCDALVDKKGEFGRVRELAAIGVQKLVKLSP